MPPQEILIVIDVQEKYISRYPTSLLPAINECIASSVSREVPVIYVLNAGQSPEGEISPLAAGLMQVPGERIVKRSPSAFTAEGFRKELEKYRDSTLVIIGIDGSCCVAKTAIEGAGRGYHVRLLQSCVGTVSDKQYRKELEEMKAAGVEIV